MSGLIETDFGSVDWEVTSDMVDIDEYGNEIYSEDYVKINNLFVSKEHRRKGYARSLMLAAIEVITNQHKGMEIKIVPEPKDDETDFSRLAAFYESLGLTVVAV